MTAALVHRVRAYSTLLPSVPLHFAYERDPEDEHVLNLAIEAGAKYLVSRDKDLLDLMEESLPEGSDFRLRFPGLIVLDPPTFLGLVARHPGAETGA